MEGETRAVSSCSDSLNCARRSLRVASAGVCAAGCGFLAVCAGREAAQRPQIAAIVKHSNTRTTLRIMLLAVLTFIRIIPSYDLLYRAVSGRVDRAVNECKQIRGKWRAVNRIRGHNDTLLAARGEEIS